MTRQPYRLNYIVDVLREAAQDADKELEEALVLLQNGYAQPTEELFVKLLISVVRAYKANAEILGIVNLLEDNQLEAAQREAERIERKRKKS
ncbi:MAG: hypothetical protein IPK17_38705 [Chloroflexi bacterium]|uniref:hypothetical protein n=1 Tax=Candidatus Flexifilum breve TaxID=3140694 RepID=UPI003135CCFB|nr:hypothetical protein [Chloroflexota bacterium]